MRTLALLVTAGSLMVGCQTYDFEHVDPLAVSVTTQSMPVTGHQLKPNVMLLVDRSASMATPIDATDPACVAGTAACKTRVSELRGAATDFLAATGTMARYGMTYFPATSGLCDPSPSMNAAVDLPPSAEESDAALGFNALSITRSLNTDLTPGGGTPTGVSLRNVGTFPALNAKDGHPNFVVLLTDGLPNCNQNNPANSCGPVPTMPACICTSASCTSTATCHAGCLDEPAVVTEIQNLVARGIRVIVIGFGAETQSGQAVTTLNAMARAGGMPRGCNAASDCGGADSCDPVSHLCSTAFHPAGNRAQLTARLNEILGGIVNPGICDYRLDAQPSGDQFLTVRLDGQALPPGSDSWEFTDSRVHFLGSACERLKASTPLAPINVEFRIVQTL